MGGTSPVGNCYIAFIRGGWTCIIQYHYVSADSAKILDAVAVTSVELWYSNVKMTFKGAQYSDC